MLTNAGLAKYDLLGELGCRGSEAAPGLWRRPYYAFAAMMILFLHAARLAMIVFDPYLSSRPLADALLKAPPGQLIEDGSRPASSI